MEGSQRDCANVNSGDKTSSGHLGPKVCPAPHCPLSLCWWAVRRGSREREALLFKDCPLSMLFIHPFKNMLWSPAMFLPVCLRGGRSQKNTGMRAAKAQVLIPPLGPAGCETVSTVFWTSVTSSQSGEVGKSRGSKGPIQPCYLRVLRSQSGSPPQGPNLTVVCSRMQCALGVGSQGRGVCISLKAGGESG